MKTFKEFMQESSLSRIKSKSDKGGMAALSASRAGKSAKENRARAKQLDRDIRGRGLGGATKVTGSYVEKGDDEFTVKEDATKADIKRAFAKSLKVKKLNKRVLSEFIELVAQEVCMSGDAGLQEEPILFYSEEMTVSKLIVLKHKGVEFDMYNKVMKKINKQK